MQFTKHVRPVILPEVQLLASVCDSYLTMMPYKTNIVEWLRPVVDLSNFYVYPMPGITAALDYWMSQESRTIITDRGDYEWVNARTGQLPSRIKYMSSPSSIDGNWRPIPTSLPVALDLAYVGTTPPHQLEIPDNVEYVFYSLSKPFALSGFRTGWLFTRKKDARLHRMVYRAEYYNTIAQKLAEEVIARYDVNYIYNRMADDQQLVCKQFNLAPSDSVWLATSADPQYSEFKRDRTARLCLTEFMGDGNVV